MDTDEFPSDGAVAEHQPPRSDVIHAVGGVASGNDAQKAGKDANNSSARIFEELLDAEVRVDPAKLREVSRAGIPPLYRSTVYRYLLGISLVDKSCEMTMERMQEKDFEGLEATFAQIAACDDSGRVRQRPAALAFDATDCEPLITRAESKFANGYRCCDRYSTVGYAAWLAMHARLKYLPQFVGNHERRRRMESAWRALQVFYSEATPDEVNYIFELTLVFESVHTTAREVFFSVISLYHLLTHNNNVLQSPQCLQRQCGTFLMLFHATNFELYRHFAAEGVSVVEWLPGMLATLLAGRLHVEDLLRLWDWYLADALETLSFPLHMYVCLAILEEMTEVLIECEKSGIIQRLHRLPRIRAGSVIQRAIALRESVVSQGLL
ncbi:Rab GTPase TBC domain [Trypanosoma vivax]|nr:hypothetical protein TRVL_03191 [Trypanosoma vivax]KAH8606292.1 Rab GTPase TBC domain [Trypanosoma vivax]